MPSRSARLVLAFPLALLLASAGCTGGGSGDGGGKSRTFWSWDLSVMPPVDKEVVATERAVTEHFYVYVEDTLWDAGAVTEAQLADLVATLEDSTPAGSIDTGAGIVENDVATFGPIPDALDGDPRVYLLLMDIEGFQTFEFDGFFRALDQEPDGTDSYRSNEIEMLYVNAEIRAVDSDTTKSVIAHELVHLLEWGQDPTEDGWLSETFGELGMTINGFYTDEDWVDDFAAHPEESLLGGEFAVHYGACLLFGNYLFERFGQSFVSGLAELPTDGETSIDGALAAIGGTESFESVFLDWVAANALDATDEYGYTFADLPPMALAATVTGTNGGAVAIPSTDAMGTRYVKLDVPGPVTLSVTHGASAPAGARIVVMRYSSADAANTFEVTTADAANPAFSVQIDGTYDEALLGLVAYGSPQTFSLQVTSE